MGGAGIGDQKRRDVEHSSDNGGDEFLKDNEIRIHIAAHKRIRLLSVSAFIETLVLMVAEANGGKPFLAELVSIRSGSIELVISVSALVVSAAQLALQMRDKFASDPFAAKVALALMDFPPAITISTNQSVHRVTPEEIRTASRLIDETVLSDDDNTTAIRGIRVGTFYRPAGRPIAILEAAPDVVVDIVDERPKPVREPLDNGEKYLFEGELSINYVNRIGVMKVYRAVRRAARYDPSIL